MMVTEPEKEQAYSIDLQPAGPENVFDIMYSDQPAQYPKANGNPNVAWDFVQTTLKDIDTSQLHWVLVPEHHIVLDLDLVDEDGEKSLEMNLAEAAKFPPTYTETSQSEKGLHLHYIYSGDVSELDNVFSPGIEIKKLLGHQSLRRKLTWCNNLEVATISSGLPKKEVKPMLEEKSMKSEKSLRDLIDRNLRKEIHPGTKPSVDFIYKILEDAYQDGMSYDVTDMRPIILAFAAKSTHQPAECLKIVAKMRFASEERMPDAQVDESQPIVFYDVEVYKNLLVVCWKYAGDANVVKMINPSPQEVEPLLRMKTVGFNNRRYDNHILWARYLGYSLMELWQLSQKIINNTGNSALFGEAFNISYTDIYDFSSKKQSLKKFEIELGIHHMELDLPWDEPVPEDKWQMVVDYCVNDVIATEATFNDRKEDFTARLILAELSGLTPNHSTQQHATRIIFGDAKRPQDSFVYTDLSEQFPGYQFDGKASLYRGEVPGEGGYVYAEPGMYENVAVLDVASMHPASIELLNLFGPYTERYSDLKKARLAIKRRDLRALEQDILGGKLAKFASSDRGDLEKLSYALKIVINTVYGLTMARFPTVFKDNRNVDNIVAKRGALFMIDLKHAVQKKGFTVAHIKTDSIKIPDATPAIIEFVKEFGEKYGYEFEHEATYERFCLVNDAVYIAREFIPGNHADSDDRWKWHAVGAQFQHPYVYKSLFTGEEITFDDLCEARSVTQGSMYLDFEMEDHDPDYHNMIHVGRTGVFVPVNTNGAALWRVKEDKYYAVTGTKGYLWIEKEMAEARGGAEMDVREIDVDFSYFEKLKQEAFEAIDYHGDFRRFVGE